MPGIARFPLALLLFIAAGPLALAQVPNATGRCVANCDAPLPPSAGASQSGGNPVVNQMGYEMGRAIGRALTTPDSGYSQRPSGYTSPDVQSVRGQLDRWAEEDAPAVSTAPARGTVASPALQSCNACTLNRDRCFTGCDSLSTNLEKLQCVNRCNENYSCVIGSDCR